MNYLCWILIFSGKYCLKLEFTLQTDTFIFPNIVSASTDHRIQYFCLLTDRANLSPCNVDIVQEDHGKIALNLVASRITAKR